MTESVHTNHWHRRLWLAQIGLALICTIYTVKIFMPIDELAKYITWVDDVPEWIVRLTGAVEALTAVGLIIPGKLRIWPFMTVVTAAGFAVLQALAIGFHIWRGELIIPLPGNIVLLCLSVFIVWGRLTVAPVVPLR